MKKKIAFLMSVLFLLSSTSALAEMPSGSVVFGKKAYSLKYVNDPENVNIIRSIIRNLKTDEKIFVKNNRGDWYANDGEKILKGMIPEVVYQTEDNKFVTYEAKDGDEIQELDFKVDNVSIYNNNTVQIIFTEKLNRENFEKYFTVGGYIDVKNISLDSEGKKVSIKLNEDIITKRYDLNIKISSNLKNINGDSLEIEYDEEILVLNKSKLEDEKFDQKVIIINHGFEGKNLSFEKGVTVSAPEVTLDNCSIKEISIDPGQGESAKICNMNIDKMKIFSGGANSIHLDNMDIQEIYINSNENTRVLGSQNSRIEIVTLESSAILETKDSEIKFIKVKDTEDEKKVELRCYVEKAIVGNNSIVESKENLNTLVIDGNVELSGKFENVEFTDKKVSVDIKSGTNIKNIDVKDNIKVKSEGNINVENITGTKEAIQNTSDAIEEGEEEYDDTPSNFIYEEFEKNGMKAKFNIAKNITTYGNKKYKKVNMFIRFYSDMLTNAELLKGVDCQVMNNGEIINYDVLQLKDNTTRMEFYIPVGSKSKITIFTQKFMGTDFEIE